jgi:hypothetical protein
MAGPALRNGGGTMQMTANYTPITQQKKRLIGCNSGEKAAALHTSGLHANRPLDVCLLRLANKLACF